MFNLIIMLREKVSVGFQSCTLRTCAVFAGRGETGRRGLPRLARPHHSDHMSGGQQRTVCFGKQRDACAHLYARTQLDARIAARTCGSQSTSKFDGGKSGPSLACSLNGTKTVFPYNLVKHWISI